MCCIISRKIKDPIYWARKTRRHPSYTNVPRFLAEFRSSWNAGRVGPKAGVDARENRKNMSSYFFPQPVIEPTIPRTSRRVWVTIRKTLTQLDVADIAHSIPGMRWMCRLQLLLSQWYCWKLPTQLGVALSTYKPGIRQLSPWEQKRLYCVRLTDDWLLKVDDINHRTIFV